MFTTLCSHQNYLIPKHSITPKETLYPSSVTSWFLHPLQALTTTNLLSSSVDLPILDISCTWNHTINGHCDWLLSLSMFSRFIHAVECIRIPFLYMPEYYCIVWIDHILFMHSSVDGHLGYFHFLAFMNNTAMNIHVQVFVWIYFQFSWIYTQE